MACPILSESSVPVIWERNRIFRSKIARLRLASSGWDDRCGVRDSPMLKFVGGLIRPYRGTLVIVLLAMLVETVMSLATPWPLKIILDNVIGNHKMSPWLHRLLGPLVGERVQAACGSSRGACLCADRAFGRRCFLHR